MTYYRIGDAAAVTYGGPFRVTASQRAQLRYASVDASGTLEPWRRARRKG